MCNSSLKLFSYYRQCSNSGKRGEWSDSVRALNFFFLCTDLSVLLALDRSRRNFIRTETLSVSILLSKIFLELISGFRTRKTNVNISAIRFIKYLFVRLCVRQTLSTDKRTAAVWFRTVLFSKSLNPKARYQLRIGFFFVYLRRWIL